MQIEHKTEKGSILFVKVPDDAHKFLLRQNKSNSDLWYNHGLPELMISSWIELPVFNWQLIGLTSEITEEMAKMMVDFKHETDIDESEPSCTSSLVDIYYPFDYLQNCYYELESFLDSFKSLMQHLQLGECKWLVLFKPEI